MGISIQTYLSAAWSHKLLCHHHWGHTISTMARRNFYHTTGFWNNNNNNKFFARTIKEFFMKLFKIPFCPKPNASALLSLSLKMWLIPPAGQRCRFIKRKNTSQLLQDRSSPKTSAAPTYQQLPQPRENEGIVCISPQPWKASCHHWAFAEQTQCQEVSACELLLVFRPGSDGLRTTTSWAQTSCLSVFSKHLAPVSAL